VTKPKHTSGPWAIKTPTDFIGPFTHIVDRTGWVVANVNSTDNNMAMRLEREANARLIAAAPELLAWTIELLKQVKQDNPNKMAGVIEHVEKLIARATGGAE
jgi:hypothetical protein